MYSRVNYTIVGIFVLIFGTGVVLFFFWLAKYGIQQEYTTYKLYMKESIAGLSKDSVVNLRGVNVGRVSEIRIDPKNVERVEVVLQIKEGTPIKEDMVAHTQMLGITGLLSIEIDGGTNSAKTLKTSDGQIPVIQTTASWFNKTTEGLGDMTEDLERVLSKAELLLSDKNIETFGSILDNTDQLTAKAVSTLDDFNRTMQSYKVGLVKLNKDIDVISTDFSRITDNTVPVLQSLKKATLDFNRLTTETEKSLNRGDYNIKEVFEPMLIDIKILTKELTGLSREIKQSPNNLLFKSRRERRGPGE